jgi:hypothetical protein
MAADYFLGAPSNYAEPKKDEYVPDWAIAVQPGERESESLLEIKSEGEPSGAN